MRILFLTPGAYGVNGGIAQHDRDFAEALDAMDDVREIVLLPRTLQSKAGPLPTKVRHHPGAANGRAAFALHLAALTTRRFDLVVCGHVNLLPLAVTAKLRSACPLALMAHGIDVWDRPRGLSPALIAAADRIWPVSELTCTRMNDWAQLPRQRFSVLHNPIRLDRYGHSDGGEHLRGKLGLKGRKILLTLARLPGFDRYKGVDEILEILPSLRRKVPQIAYVVAGEGEDRPRLEQKARDLGVADIAHFTGFVAEEEKADHYRLADAFVMPGRAEGFGYVYLEALACGTPVVGSALDGSREALRDGLLGELPDPRNLDEIEAAVLRALNKPKGIPAGLDYFGWSRFQNRVAGEVRALAAGMAEAA